MHITKIQSPIVTVFMAVFNGEKYITEAINSILNQSFTDFELLIINDGSTDKTVEIIDQFDDLRIHLLHNASNKGLTYTRNRGIDEANGKYIAVMDSDDISLPDRLKTQICFMEANPEVALCGGHAIFIDGYSREIGRYEVAVGNNLSYKLVLQNIFVNSTLIMKKTTMVEVGGYRDMSPAEDYDLSFRISQKNRVANLSEDLVKYREHGNNTSMIQKEKQRNAEYNIIKHIQSNLNIPINEITIKTHHNLIRNNVDATNPKQILKLLEALKHGNVITHAYPFNLFDRMLFETWFLILRETREKNIIILYFRNNLFDWSLCSFKQIRKIVKQTFFLNLPFRN